MFENMLTHVAQPCLVRPGALKWLGGGGGVLGVEFRERAGSSETKFGPKPDV